MQLLNLIPSHKVALWLVEHIDNLLDRCGLMRYPTLEQAIYLIIVVFIALGVGLAVRHAVVWIVRKIVRLRDGELGRQLLQQRVIQKCSHFIPPLVFMGMVPFAFDSQSPLMHAVDKGVLIYAIVAIAYGVAAVLKFVFQQVNSRRNTRNLPVQGVLNVVLGILWIIVAIVCVSVLVDKSPGTLLAGLTAFAAALMLIFKDSILGFVAGIQMSENDMLHVGDWIVVPSSIANGIVIDASLTTIKVQNWDNTIVTIPPYNLISGSFQNWRGMSDSGVRQIARSILFDSYSITTLDKETLDGVLEKYPIVKPYVDKLEASGKQIVPDPGQATVNGTLSTNMGLFRAYMCQWLLNNPGISNSNQILVRLMAPTENGVPLQIWCFTSTTAWTAYEAIQSDLFEHIIAVAPDFGLRVFNETSGADVLTIDYPDSKKIPAAETPAPSAKPTVG